MMRSKLLEGLKCESQRKNNEKARSHGTLLGSQHCRGVEGCARALGQDQEEVTSFNHSHGPTQNQHQVVNAQLEHFWCQDEPQVTRTHKTHHGPDLGETINFLFILYFVPLYMGHIQVAFCPRTPKWESRNFHNSDSCNFGGITSYADLQLQ